MELLTVSHSQAGVWDRCEEQWRYNYQLGIVPKNTKDYFQKGTFSHQLLAVHFTERMKGNRNTWDAVLEFVKSMPFDASDGNALASFKAALRIVNRYIAEYAPIHDKFRVLDVERHFVVEMVTPKGRPYKLQGYFDLLIEWEGALWIVDHKTVGQGKFWSMNELLMDSQMTTYLLALREQGQPVFGCVINQLNTYDYKDFAATPVEKLFRREKIYRTEKQIQNMALNYGKIVDEMYDHEGDYRKSYRKDCPRCPYFELCLMDTKGMDISAALAVSYKPKDPRPAEDTEEPEPDWA